MARRPISDAELNLIVESAFPDPLDWDDEAGREKSREDRRLAAMSSRTGQEIKWTASRVRPGARRRLIALAPQVGLTLESRDAKLAAILTLGNWVDLGEITPRPKDTCLRRQLGVEDLFALQYSGNLGAFGGQAVILEAARCSGMTNGSAS